MENRLCRLHDGDDGIFYGDVAAVDRQPTAVDSDSGIFSDALKSGADGWTTQQRQQQPYPGWR